jgi:hypothetical protein
MPTGVFVAFNVTWILIWFVSIPGVDKGSRLAFFVAWFLANGLPATLGASPQIWYGADTQLSEWAGDTLGDKAAVVVLTFTN